MKETMKTAVILVLLVALVLAADEEGEQKRIKGRGKWRSKLREALGKFNGRRNNRTDEDFEYIRERLKRRRERFKARYNLTDEQAVELRKQLKAIRHANRTRIGKNGDSIQEINANVDTEGVLFEGDILLTKEQMDVLDGEDKRRFKRQAYKDRYYPSTIWSGTIPYTLDSSLSADAKRVIAKGLDFWQSNTCIRFKLNGSGANSLKFFSGGGCYSYVGRIASWKEQEISIGNGCESISTVTHEVGHALGFFHGQSRNDRDSYVTINLANVQSGMEGNFNKESTATNYNYGLPYDYGSVMHYGPYSFSVTSNAITIVPKQAEYLYTMGSGREPSFYDVLMMNKHYNCMAACNSYSTVCYNGGYMDVNNCKVCKCPAGYGGNDCSQRTPGCGSTVTATSSYQTLTSQLVGTGKVAMVDEFAECTYWITAPTGKKIQVVLDSVGYVCAEGCYYGGVEIKSQANQLLTGYRYCCQEHKGKTLTSTSNRVPIIVFNRYYYSGFTIRYRYV